MLQNQSTYQISSNEIMTKEMIVAKLLESKSITCVEAAVLLKETVVVKEISVQENTPLRLPDTIPYPETPWDLPLPWKPFNPWGDVYYYTHC